MHKDIIIIGAGFSGTLLAAHLVRQNLGGRSIHLVADDTCAPGRGVAYATPMGEHLLNVRAQQMSAWAEDPEHFVRWLAKEIPARRGEDAVLLAEQRDDMFAPRRLYGQYLEDILSEALRTSRAEQNVALTVHAERAQKIERATGGLTVTLSSGRTFCGTVILCTGHLTPRWPRALAACAAKEKTETRLIQNPWDWSRLGVLHEAKSVGIVGTGLSMIDTVLTLAKRNYQGPIFAFSRHGYLPMRHRLHLSRRDLQPRERPTTARALVRAISEELELADKAGDDWRQVIDALRPVTQGLWRALSDAEQGRVWRHAKSLWDAHRHRIAPEVADTVDGMRTRGQLTIFGGSLRRAEMCAEGIRVNLSPRRGGAEAEHLFDRLVNCTGGALTWDRADDPFYRSLFAQGLAKPGPRGLGPQANEQGALLDAAGAVQSDLLVMGPALAAHNFESVAVPELRIQAAHLARFLSASSA